MGEEVGSVESVAVVGNGAAVTEALSATGLTTAHETPAAALDVDPDALVAIGEPALRDVARQRPGVPVLPVDAGAGVRSVPRERVAAAATRLVTGDWRTETHPILVVDEGDRTTHALLDAMLVTAEPAHISEFTVTTGEDPVAQFRADGLVAATPAGSLGYARTAGAPVLKPGTGVLGVAPVAPFATTLDHWVVPADDLTVTVERDDAAVDVLADDRTVGHATVGTPVEISTDGAVRTIRVPEGQSPFGWRGAELEKL
jgi:NAD+ kinase